MEVVGIDKETDLIWVRCPTVTGFFHPILRAPLQKTKTNQNKEVIVNVL
jgi:hypothetical protein